MDLVEFLNYAIAFFSLFVVNIFILIYLRHRHDYLKTPENTGWEPFISIILPAYNEGAYIRNSLNSLLEVDYPKNKMEIIIVNDGSTDNTLEIAKEFESRTVRIYTKKNGGKGAALNYGIKKSRGELIATMDADSYISRNAIRELLPFFDAEKAMAVTPAVKIRPSNSPLKELQRVEYLMILFSRKLLSFIDSVPVTPGPFSIFRREVFDKVGLFDEHNLVEDQEIALRIQSHHYKIKSSLTADVYTEPPDNLPDLLRQRVRWQRGGFRNYWKYKFMIRPDYGDFGMYFVPLNFATITAFFLILAIMLYSVFTTPYYVQYIWLDAFGYNVGLFTFVGAFVIITSILFTYLSVKSFKNEKVAIPYIISFILFYWYLMVGYNLLFVYKELRREGYSW
ncbi:glycosyltransferase family 2 protein [Candidatus Micrarchaeota archaeon]|nr:glycosyltransferase family 2 protein [Candidatus Micrarchaeota archaeon]